MKNKKIEPNQVYTTPQAADLIGTSDLNLINEIKKEKLKAKLVGKGWKILGSNLLTYISTPTTITQKMQPNVQTISIKDDESKLHDITHGSKGEDMLKPDDSKNRDYHDISR